MMCHVKDRVRRWRKAGSLKEQNLVVFALQIPDEGLTWTHLFLSS
jgi:hypothetical protein